MLAIYKKELGSYFRNPLGYVFVCVYLVASALIFCYTTFKAKSYDTSRYFAMMIYAFIILVPLLTMRLFSEEKKLKTEQLVLTAPISLPSMVFGKFFASYTVFGAATVLTSLYFLLLIPYTDRKSVV